MSGTIDRARHITTHITRPRRVTQKLTQMYRCQALGVTLIGQLLIIDTGHFNVDVEAIQEGTADLLLETGNHYTML
jgi:hypothetical protein